MLGLGIFLFNLEPQNNPLAIKEFVTNQPPQGEEIPIQGRDHITLGQTHAPYNSNPPTSGPHSEYAEKWGIFSEPQPDEKMVHNLEHGGIWISYKDIDPETKTKLEAIAKANPGSVIMTPRSANESKIAVAAWGRLLKLEEYNESKIIEFIKANKNKAPEQLAK